jgi:hypothetical protein
VISLATLLRWAVASNDQAVRNARAAATECSRLRLERAEVEQYLARIGSSAQEQAAKAVASGS